MNMLLLKMAKANLSRAEHVRTTSAPLRCRPAVVAVGVNRGVPTPPGLDEQWLLPRPHRGRQDVLVNEFQEFAEALRA